MNLFADKHTITLRPYQEQAVEAVYAHLRARDDNPCVVIPTAGGKTPVMATICRDAVKRWAGRVLIIAHVKELLEQAAEKLQTMAPDVPVGIYSAGLGRRDKCEPVIVAGIQSIYQRACELGKFDLILIDEAHLIPPDGEGMYQTFLGDARIVNPNIRLIGLTATPYRMTTGMICEPEHLLNHVCYEVGVKELIAQGYLCPLRSKAGKCKTDTSGVHIRGGEFVAGELELLMNDEYRVQAACREIVEHTKERHSVLIFASGVKHAEHVQKVLGELGHDCGFICGETLDFERATTLQAFKAGKLKHLVNVNVLTTGFDATNIDCVVLLRPTNSPGLYYQMIGRGFRLHHGKADCLILDFGSNILRHGPVDCIQITAGTSGSGMAPSKECPECSEVVHAGYSLCPACGYEFPPPDRKKHDNQASTENVLSGVVTDTTYTVSRVAYTTHEKRNPKDGDKPSMRVDYQTGFNEWKSEWICFEHQGYALQKAGAWWRRRSKEAVPESVEEAVNACRNGSIATTKEIVVRSVSGERFDRIIGYEIGEIPEPEIYRDESIESEAVEQEAWIDEADIPF